MRVSCSRVVRHVRVALVLVGVLLAGGAHAPAAAQTPFVPYYGQNAIHFDRFDWHIYTTDHFEIYYYPDIERHLERVAGYAESAYQKVSADLKHDLPAKVPLILFKTHSEFEQQNVAPGAAQEGVAAFAEPFRNRMLLPIDDAPDELYGLITHELTHIFEFDIIPQGLIRQSVPLWVNEGLSDYERGTWDPLDLMMVRDAAVSDVVPKMSELQGYGDSSNPRLIYNLGHAVFEFIEARVGKEGLRQFLFALRKSVIGGGQDAYEEALKLKPEEFDQAFERYLKERFKPFRDKERQDDYGRDLSPNQKRTHYAQAISIVTSPSGDLLAAVTINRKDGEADIVLLSTKDGAVVRNLTQGFDRKYGFDHIVLLGARWNTMPWMSWSPKGDRLAYFVRTGKERTLIVQNILTRDIELRVPMTTVDEPESPSFSPDGNTVAFAGLRGGIGDIFTVDLASRAVTNLTTDGFFDYGPTFSPDGGTIIYVARVSGNEKLFRLDLRTHQKTQLTFGTSDETAAQYLSPTTLVFSSTMTNPETDLDPAVARNGAIYNAWTLDLTTGALQQYTDALGGVLSPVVLTSQTGPRLAFVSYEKGDYSVHTLELKRPVSETTTAAFGAPGPIIDFEAPLSHTLVAANQRRKKPFEKLFLQGRPPVSVGVTSNGDVFGGTQVSVSDVLGDKQLNFLASSVAAYKTFALSYVNVGSRFQYALQGISQTTFFYGQLTGVLYDPTLAPFISRDLAQATRTVRGGTAFGSYPFNRYQRLEVSGGIVQVKEQYNDAALQDYSRQYQQQVYGQQLFRSGLLVPLSAALVHESTVFREFGPLSGTTGRISYDVAPKIGTTLSRQTFSGDVRIYQRLATSGVLALRLRGFKSIGSSPDFLYFGGNSELRGYDYLQFVGQNAGFVNAELRFPIIELAKTPIGVVGGVRGVFFANVGGGWFNNQNYKFATRAATTLTPVTGYQTDALGNYVVDADGLPIPISGTPQTITGFRLQDGRASYGFGLETFALGFPIHFDWSWRTLFNTAWEDQVFASSGGSATFRKPRFAVWIGYDF